MSKGTTNSAQKTEYTAGSGINISGNVISAPYAPTTAGEEGQVYTSDGSGTGVWKTPDSGGNGKVSVEEYGPIETCDYLSVKPLIVTFGDVYVSDSNISTISDLFGSSYSLKLYTPSTGSKSITNSSIYFDTTQNKMCRVDNVSQNLTKRHAMTFSGSNMYVASNSYGISSGAIQSIGTAIINSSYFSYQGESISYVTGKKFYLATKSFSIVFSLKAYSTSGSGVDILSETCTFSTSADFSSQIAGQTLELYPVYDETAVDITYMLTGAPMSYTYINNTIPTSYKKIIDLT